jgi:hypothetical protein
MKVPSWVIKWLTGHQLNIEAFKEKLGEVADKIDAPEEWKTAVSLWLDENATLSPEVVLAFVALVYAELTSGAPGYNPGHGGLA